MAPSTPHPDPLPSEGRGGLRALIAFGWMLASGCCVTNGRSSDCQSATSRSRGIANLRYEVGG